MSTNIKSSELNEDNFDLKDLILKIQYFYLEVLKSWKFIFIIVVVFTSFFVFKALTTPKTYSAELSFMVNEDEGGGLGGAMSILNQFGIGGSNSEYNLEKIVDLAKSRRISQAVFFEKITINESTDYIANHIIDIYQLHDNWDDDDSPLQDFKFSSDELIGFSRVENLALRLLYERVIGPRGKTGLFATDINDNTGIMYLSMTSKSEELSIKWVEHLFKHLSEYYIAKTIEKQKATYNIVKEKVDSIKLLLDNAEFQLANFKDSNRNLWSKTASLTEQRLARNVQMLTLMYGEAVKNLEIAEFSLKNKTPFIQLIDSPVAPLSSNSVSLTKSGATGVILGLLVGSGFIIIRRIYQDVMND